MSDLVKRLRDADFAYCYTCEVNILPTISWGLGKAIHLHRNGFGSAACKIQLYRTVY